MGELNIPTAEVDALNAISADALREHIDQCLRGMRSLSDRTLRLDSCGAYVGSRLRAFDQALVARANAKSAKKLAETEHDARKAGGDLEHAVQQMKTRAAAQRQEEQFFVVDDHVEPPFRFSEHLSVRVGYRWKEGLEAKWQYGAVTFSHTHIPRPNYLAPAPARKLSRAKQERQRQEALYRQWEYLKSLSLHAVRDHFRSGGSGATIPQAVQAKKTRTRRLSITSAPCSECQHRIPDNSAFSPERRSLSKWLICNVFDTPCASARWCRSKKKSAPKDAWVDAAVADQLPQPCAVRRS